jgi:hypothetical protein
MHLLGLQDVLDMYGAWRVVIGIHPRLPAAPRTRAAWLLHLSHGAVDAREHPEQFEGVIALLWGALRHSDVAARAAAATALAHYPVELLKELELSQPLCNMCEVRRSYACLIVAVSAVQLRFVSCIV